MSHRKKLYFNCLKVCFEISEARLISKSRLTLTCRKASLLYAGGICSDSESESGPVLRNPWAATAELIPQLASVPGSGAGAAAVND